MDEPRTSGESRVGRLLGIAAAGVLAGLSGAAAMRVTKAWRTAQRTIASGHSPAEGRTRLLIVGDGAGAGTGADACHSLAARIGRLFPMTVIENRARPGARFSEVLQQLHGTSRYDAILIVAGGSDVIRMTGNERLRDALRDAVWRARMRAPLVVVIPPGDVGAAPFFLPPLSGLLTRRSRLLVSFARHAAREFGAVCVPFIREPEQDPFLSDPRRYYAQDKLHFSSDGYGMMLVELLRAVPLGRFLRGRTSVTDRHLAEQLAERP